MLASVFVGQYSIFSKQKLLVLPKNHAKYATELGQSRNVEDREFEHGLTKGSNIVLLHHLLQKFVYHSIGK